MKNQKWMEWVISYSFQESRWGRMMTATTGKGLCCVSFAEDAEKELTRRFPGAEYSALGDISGDRKSVSGDNESVSTEVELHHKVLELVNGWPSTAARSTELALHLSGTDFQLAVWKALQTLQPGELSTYKAIAEKAGRPTAIRATGTAIGQNPIALFIPCHRVVTSSGTIGGYRWGLSLKSQLIELEKMG